MIEIHSDHKPNLQIFINNELFIDQIVAWKHCKIEPTVNTKINCITVKNTGAHSFTANGHTVEPNKLIEIANK